MPHTFDAAAVRDWCARALDALGSDREAIDAINVYPVADADTGTNLYLTVEAAAQAVEAACAGEPTTAEAVAAMAHGALLGARGNSGTILAQLLRGMAEGIAAGTGLCGALERAAHLARDAVAHPVEGTILTVAAAAATAAREAAPPAGGGGDGTGRDRPDDAAVARAACEGARAALAATPGQLAALGGAGVVDAGGYGLHTVLGALLAALTGERPARPPTTVPDAGQPRPSGGAAAPAPAGGCAGAAAAGPEFEVIYLLEAQEAAVAALRHRLDALGDSLVVVGGDGLWHVHVHVDDAGAAVEAGLEAGRPHRVRITHLTGRAAAPALAERAVVAVVPGDGLARLCTEAGATAVTVRPEEPPGSGELAAAVRGARAREVVLLLGGAELRHTAAAATEQVRTEGVRVAIIPARSPVQALAALAVHEPSRRFDEDVVAMTSAAGATRFAELAVAERQAWTTCGVCQAGDVLGLIDGDVALIGTDLTAAATEVLERMLAAGGELVTLVLGAGAPEGLARHLRERVRRGHLGVDTVVYTGRQPSPLLIGVE
ncbi:DAK2 domain-containing protein [Streptomyces sp. TRM 70351]|uniref:DAK2 domain-containing protein n=1 Tax=Streptomyces sp. TRM 70351 TaxID=3116552 RepID=UPI002E7ADFFA|nr:DAK2 domain-containing protein [Streptomyces sp. TRM 70351]MEE1931168.1 DAK2 domain-containing protein [Streptomyces sp. TRM 70351]